MGKFNLKILSDNKFYNITVQLEDSNQDSLGKFGTLMTVEIMSLEVYIQCHILILFVLHTDI